MATEADDYLSFDGWTDSYTDHFALRVQGNSMLGDHICDGDHVIIQKRRTAAAGQIVAIRDECGDATLRRYQPLPNGQVRLEASNPEVKPVVRGDVDILGVLVGVVRKY